MDRIFLPLSFLKRPPTRSRYRIRWRLLFRPLIRSLFSIESEESGNQVFFDVYTEGHYYAYCKSSKIDTVSISSASVNKTYKKVKYDYILDLGRHETGDHVTLTNDEDSVLNAVVVRLDEAVLSRTLQTLSEQPSYGRFL